MRAVAIAFAWRRSWAAFAVLAVCGLAACNGSSSLRGPAIEMSAADISRYAKNQESMLRSFSELAGLHSALPERGDPGWQDIALAGINYSDLQCERFIGAIFAWNRKQTLARQELTLAATTTTTVLGLINASQQAMISPSKIGRAHV